MIKLAGLMLLALSLACGEIPSSQISNGEAGSKELIGGMLATSNLFPATVFLKLVKATGKHSTCTAAKIGSHQFLLAAHCVFPEQPITVEIAALIGSAGQEQLHNIQQTAVLAAAVHPSYRDFCASGCSGREAEIYYQGAATDVAVLTVENTTSSISTAAISSAPIEVGQTVIIQGFGCEDNLIDRTGRQVLKYETTTISSADWPYFSTPGQASSAEAASLCYGDSGGPVYREVNGQKAIVGINAYYSFEDSKEVSWSNLHTALADPTEPSTFTWLQGVLGGTQEQAWTAPDLSDWLTPAPPEVPLIDEVSEEIPPSDEVAPYAGDDQVRHRPCSSVQGADTLYAAALVQALLIACLLIRRFSRKSDALQ